MSSRSRSQTDLVVPHTGSRIRRRPRRRSRRRKKRRSTACTPALSLVLVALPLPTLTRSLDRSDAMPTSLFFSHNEALVPPYRVIVDTNFINLSLENRVDIVKAMMDVLYAKGSSHSACCLFDLY